MSAPNVEPTPVAPPAPAPTPKESKKKVTKASGTAGTKAKVKKPTTKKKSKSKASSVSSTQSILADARIAQMDLAQQRAVVAAKKSDPLWYKIEDVFSSIGDANAMVARTNILPEQIHIVEAALQHNGLSRVDVTPQAMACLLEQARRYAFELLTDAQDYAFAANRPEVNKSDVSLAAEMRPDYAVAISTQLPRLNLVAQQVNRAPLPPIPSQCFGGILLPPREYQLTARTYDIVSSLQTAQKVVQGPPQSPRQKKVKVSPPTVSITTTTATCPTYGALKGKQQIPINLKQEQGTTPEGDSSSPLKAMDISTGSSPPSNTATGSASHQSTSYPS